MCMCILERWIASSGQELVVVLPLPPEWHYHTLLVLNSFLLAFVLTQAFLSHVHVFNIVLLAFFGYIILMNTNTGP